MNPHLKIRGIYATALTKFFVDRGITIVCSSPVIQERFGDNAQIDPLKAYDLEIRDLESAQGILLQGQSEAFHHVVNLIKGTFPDPIIRNRTEDRFHARAEIEFPYQSKSALDDLRNSVMPTLFNHHRLRLIAPEYLDLTEKKGLSNHTERRTILSQNLERTLIWRTYQIGKEMGIDHVKLNGPVISLSEGRIVEIDPEERKLTLKRSKFIGRSRYDGLGTPKEKGDYAITRVKEGDWYYQHSYYRKNGQLIGTYYNVNTLVEFYPDKMRYVDLEIDVICWPDGKTQIIDQKGLKDCFEAGCLSEALKRTAEKTAEELMGKRKVYK